MPKNVVICCDGTNNSFQRDLTNVARMSRIALLQDGVQHVYYDVGVGVREAPGLITRTGTAISRGFGLAFGTGLIRNVLEAYTEIVAHYLPDDRVFLFGFSRGAYTVRVLAGLLRHYGLLKKEHRSMAGLVVEKFQVLFPKDGSDDEVDPAKRRAYLDRTFGEAREIKASQSIACSIHFMGIWDTVSSLGWAYDPKTFPNTAEMPEVKTIRHALAIDERRAMFRTNRVEVARDGQQDIQEVWFAGVHSDVGGGYPATESGLARTSLRWMLREAEAAGLVLDPNEPEAQSLATGDPLFDELAPQHESLTGLWTALEYIRLPHRRNDGGRWITEMIRYRGKGWRTIREGDMVSMSLQRRIAHSPIKNQNWPEVQSHVRWLD